MKANIARWLVLGLLVGCGSGELQDTGKLLHLDQDQILFGEVALGSTVTVPLRVTNLGRVQMSLAALEVPEGFEVNPQSFILDAGAKTSVEVSFRPTGGNLHLGSIRFDSTSGDGASLHVEGRGLADLLETPATVDFGLVPVGNQRTMEVPILNLIDQEIELALEITGSEEFTSGKTSMRLGARERAMVQVRFRPREASGRSARLRVQSCEGCVIHSVSLFGEGVEKEIVVHPAWLDFGQVAVGLSKTLPFQVRNSGVVPLELALPEPESKAFQFNPDSGEDLRLAAGESKYIYVTFAPAARGVDEETVGLEDVSTWDLGGIFVRGEAVASLEANPTRLIFLQPAGVTFSQVVEVVNLNPSREVGIVRYGLEGLGAEGFELTGPAPGATIGQSSQRFTVSYKAVAETSHEAMLVIETEDLTSRTLRIPIVGGEFVGRCELRQSHSVMNFGIMPFEVGLSRRLELTNVGSESCFVWDLRIQECDPCDDDYFQIVEPETFKIIEVGEIYPIDVEALPRDLSAPPRTLQYRYANVFEPASEVPLTYTVAHPEARIFEIDPLSPTMFPDTKLGSRSERTVKIRSTNEGAFGLIESVSFSDDTSPAFKLSPSNPLMPAVFGRDWISFDVVFEPLVVDRVYGQVVIEMKGTNFEEKLRFDLVGTGVVTSQPPLSLELEQR